MSKSRPVEGAQGDDAPINPPRRAGPDDQEMAWIRGAVAGDRQAFDQLVRRYQRQAVAVSYRLLGNPSDATEIVQDAFLKAWKSLDSLQRPEAFVGWLMRIVSNLSLNRRRGRSLRKAHTLDDAAGMAGASTGGTDLAGESLREGETDPLRSLMGNELGVKLRLALEALPEKQRTAILLFTIEQMPQKDVAEVLGCSVEAVKWHVFQGRKRLKDMLKDYL